MRAEPYGEGIRITLKCVWRDGNDTAVLDEARTFEIALAGDATVCDVTSRKVAAHGKVEFPASKFGGIGVRLDPRMLPGAGGCIIADEGRRGDANVVHGHPSRFVAYEGAADEASRFGLCLIGENRTVPWFVRDYGLALWNPTWQKGFELADGQAREISLRLVAYDGTFDESRAERWLRV